MRPKLLDLFCGAGGASMGYCRAGFEVEGVDIKPQPHYPFKFYQADALTFPLEGYDAYHASPPCQRYSSMTKGLWPDRVAHHPDLISEVRTRLLDMGKPYIIENIPQAPLLNPVMLCGSMFGLHSGEFHLRRHRHFESSLDFWPPAACCHQGLSLSVYGHPGGNSCRDHRKFGAAKDWRIGMDIDWMTNDELAQAIPPCYTEYIGKNLLSRLSSNVSLRTPTRPPHIE